MAITPEDIFAVHRPSTKTLFKVPVQSLPFGDKLPDGNEEGDYLRWNGTDTWEPSDTIDGGTY